MKLQEFNFDFDFNTIIVKFQKLLAVVYYLLEMFY